MFEVIRKLVNNIAEETVLAINSQEPWDVDLRQAMQDQRVDDKTQLSCGSRVAILR